MSEALPALIHASPPSLSGSPISTPLWRLLSSHHDASTEVAEIVAVPELHREAKAVCHALTQRAAGAGEAGVRAALQPLVLTYGVGEAAKSPGFWQAYRVLATVPVEALRAGIEEYNTLPDSHFFPKPGPLKALCDRHAEPIFKAAARANRAASLAPPKRAPTPDEREQVHRMAQDVAELLKASAAKGIPTRAGIAPLPSIAGKADERGLTAEMRELMARQGR